MIEVLIERTHSRDQRQYLLNETKKVFALQKSSTPSGLVWVNAKVSLFRDTNMADVTHMHTL